MTTRQPIGTKNDAMFFDLYTGHCYMFRAYTPEDRAVVIEWVRDHQRLGLINDFDAEQLCLEIADNTWEPVNEPHEPEARRAWPWIIGVTVCVLTLIFGGN